MAMKSKVSGTDPLTATVYARGSYLNLAEPRREVDENNGKVSEKYQASLIIPKADTSAVAAVESVLNRALTDKWGEKRPAVYKFGLRDGDEKNREGEYARKDDAYRDAYFINVSSKSRPKVIVGRPGETRAAKPEELMSGFWFLWTIRAFSYDRKDSKGVSAGLNGAWLVKRDEILGGTDATEELESAAADANAEDFEDFDAEVSDQDLADSLS